MKIVRIIARLNVGGPARHVVWLTEALSSGEFESVLVAGTVPPGEENMEYFAAEHGVTPIRIREMSRELSPKDVVSLWKVYRVLRRERPDIIHTHTAKAGTVGRAAALLYRLTTRRRVRVVHTFHGHVFHSYYGPAKTALFIAIERILARLATDRIVVISEQQLAEINGTFGIGRPDRFRVVPLGIDLEPFRDPRAAERGAELRRESGIGPDDFVVGFAGRLTEIKNIPMLLRAAAIVAGRPEGAGVRTAIAGDGHLRPELEAEANRLGIADRVLFLGNRQDTAAVYAASDIVALSSLNEGTPLSLIEAMAAGKAVISASVGGVVDLLGPVETENGRYDVRRRGVSVGSGDAEGLAEGIIRLAGDRTLRESLAATGSEFVTRQYDRRRLADDIRDLYRELGAENA